MNVSIIKTGSVEFVCGVSMKPSEGIMEMSNAFLRRLKID